MKNQREKGITLVALVITIIILLILAGIAISQLTENGLFNKTQVAKEKYTAEEEKERLEIEIANFKMQMYMNNNGKEMTLNDLKTYLDSEKFNGEYMVELFYEPLATTENVSTKPVYAKVTHIPTRFVFYVDGKLVVIGGSQPTKTTMEEYQGTWLQKAGLDDTNFSSLHEVLSNTQVLTSLFSSEEATNYLLINSKLIEDIKSDENYENAVPVMLNYAKTSVSINRQMYNAKLPCYIYDHGTYYLIESMTYQGPTNSCRTTTFNNTVENGMYFYAKGTTSASQSTGIYYSNKSVNPYNYSKMGMTTYQTKDMEDEWANIGLFNGSVTSVEWTASYSGGLCLKNLEDGEHTTAIDIPEEVQDEEYSVFLNQNVNKYLTSGNYYIENYVRSLWLE